MFIVGKFSRIEVHPMILASLVLDMLLHGVVKLQHALAASGAVDVPNLVLLATDGRNAAIDEIRPPLPFKHLGFTDVKPDTLTTSTPVNGNPTTQCRQRLFFHRGTTFWAVQGSSPIVDRTLSAVLD